MQFVRFLHDPLERFEISVPAEHHHPSHGAIEHVVDQTAGSNAGATGHLRKTNPAQTPRQKN
jgi:hypothetical protein